MTDTPRGRPPWQLEEQEDRFVILDADGQPLYTVLFRRPHHKVDPLERMPRDEALKVAQPLLRLPELLRQEKARRGDG